MATEESKEKFGFGCYLPLKLVEEIDALAEKEQRSRNNMIDRLLRAALDAKDST